MRILKGKGKACVIVIILLIMSRRSVLKVPDRLHNPSCANSYPGHSLYINPSCANSYPGDNSAVTTTRLIRLLQVSKKRSRQNGHSFLWRVPD